MRTVACFVIMCYITLWNFPLMNIGKVVWYVRGWYIFRNMQMRTTKNNVNTADSIIGHTERKFLKNNGSIVCEKREEASYAV